MSHNENKTANARIMASVTLRSETLTVEQISSQLGIAPDSSRNKGENNKAGKPFKKHMWKIRVERNVDQEPDHLVQGTQECLLNLLARIEPKLDIFQRLAISEEAILLIGIVSEFSPPFVIPGDLLVRIARLNLSHLEIDLIV